MADSEISMEPLLAWDGLLKPIPGDSPSGVSLRNTPEYDELQKALKPQDTAPVGGVWQRDAKATDYLALIRSATSILATRSKDLDVAVWLTEALVREHRLAGLTEGLLLIQQLTEAFWDTIYPMLDEGDEGFRAKPIGRLNKAFISALLQLPITSDGFTIYQYNASSVIATADKAKSDDLRKKREEALADGTISPEDMEKSVQATMRGFYDGMADEVLRAEEAVALLQKTIDKKFTTSDRPSLEKLQDQLAGVRVSVQTLQRKKAADAPVVKAPEPPPAAVAPPVAVTQTPAQPQPPAPIPVAPVASIPDIEPLKPRTLFELASELRAEDPSSPVPYMLVRGWQFGPLLANGRVDEDLLQPPSTEFRTALRRAVLNGNWNDMLEQTEQAMETACGGCWLDLQQHAARACQELGYIGAANAIKGVTAAYLRSLPALSYAVMLDGSPTASADTLTWLRREVLVDPDKNRTESLDEVRPVIHTAVEPEQEPDAFEVAENELASGRFTEAFRILAEALGREQSGRGRMQRKIQLAKICMEGTRNRLALSLLQEICSSIDDRHLDQWEAPEFVVPPLVMLYRCLEQSEEADAAQVQRRRIYHKLCALDPVKALELTALP